jgi:hypothetical protein
MERSDEVPHAAGVGVHYPNWNIPKTSFTQRGAKTVTTVALSASAGLPTGKALLPMWNTRLPVPLKGSSYEAADYAHHDRC